MATIAHLIEEALAGDPESSRYSEAERPVDQGLSVEYAERLSSESRED